MRKITLGICILCAFVFVSCQNNNQKANYMPRIEKDIITQAQDNDNWKVSKITGQQGQVVFMNISTKTNPKNEIGLETHPFDQFILIVKGNGKAILNDHSFNVDVNDMIFVPKGCKHNVVNLNQSFDLKLVSFYSENDMPINTTYKTKADDPEGRG